MSYLLEVDKHPQRIFLPCVAMAALTFSQLVRLGNARASVLRNRQVSMKYYRVYNEGGEPESVAKISQHIENLFESPPLFYIAVIILYVLKAQTPTAAGLAWAYVGARAVHCYIHTGSNNVRHRFFAFFSSIGAMAALWGLVAQAALAE